MDWITDNANYCRHKGLNNINVDGQSLKLFLFYRHETLKIAKRSSKRQKVSKGEDIMQKTGEELYSILSAEYFSHVLVEIQCLLLVV